MPGPAIAPTVLGGVIAAGAGVILQMVIHLLLVRRETDRRREDLTETRRAEERRYDEHVVQQRLAAYADLAAWVLVARSQHWGKTTTEGHGEKLALPADIFGRVHVHGTADVRQALHIALVRLSSAGSAMREFNQGGVLAFKVNSEFNSLEVEVDKLMSLLPAEVQFAEPGTTAEIPGQTRAWPRAR